MPETAYIPDPRDGSTTGSRAFDCCDDCIGPTAPSGLILSAAGAFVIDVSWTDNSSDETGFDIRWRNVTTDSGFTDGTSEPADSTNGQVTVTGATDGDTIEVQVRASGVDCNSGWISDEVIVIDTN